MIDFKNKLLFVGGMHGSGKDTYCQKNLSQWHIVSASEIIKQRRGNVNTDKTIQHSDIHSNQKLLIHGCLSLREQYDQLAITGHFCLSNKDTQDIHQIPLSVFLQINPTRIILLKASANQIQHRLKARDQKEWDIDFITRVQEQEIKRGQQVARQLDISFEVIESYIKK